MRTVTSLGVAKVVGGYTASSGAPESLKCTRAVELKGDRLLVISLSVGRLAWRLAAISGHCPPLALCTKNSRGFSLTLLLFVAPVSYNVDNRLI